MGGAQETGSGWTRQQPAAKGDTAGTPAAWASPVVQTLSAGPDAASPPPTRGAARCGQNICDMCLASAPRMVSEASARSPYSSR